MSRYRLVAEVELDGEDQAAALLAARRLGLRLGPRASWRVLDEGGAEVEAAGEPPGRPCVEPGCTRRAVRTSLTGPAPDRCPEHREAHKRRLMAERNARRPSRRRQAAPETAG